MVDTLREPRAMMLAALPYPPLPIQVHKVADDSMVLESDTEDGVTTTHTLIALCVNECVKRNDHAFNERRRTEQMRVLEEFMYGLQAIGCTLSDKELYHFYCDYSYRHLCTYFDKSDVPHVKFKPYEYVSRGDKTHQKMLEHYFAQGIVFEENPEERPSDDHVRQCSVGELLELFRNRLAKIKD